MTDLISRQDAIDALSKIVPYAIDDVSTESYTNGLTDAYNLICQLPSAQQWHTGEPPEDGDYLVFDTEEYYTVDAYYTHNGTEEYGAYLAYKGWQSCNHVKYWMPLPELPEVGE